MVIRELILGSSHFNEIQRAIPSIPTASLSQRLKTLEETGIVMRWLDGSRRPYYQLTPSGAALEPVIKAMGTWGHYWLNREIREDDLDLRVLMWDVHRRINVDSLPEGRTVVQSTSAVLVPGGSGSCSSGQNRRYATTIPSWPSIST